MHKSNKIIKLKKIRYADTKDNFLSFILIVKRKVIYCANEFDTDINKIQERNVRKTIYHCI